MTLVRRYPWEIAGLIAFTVVALLMTMTIANTLARRDSGDMRHYSAVFADASGIRVGDDVRIAGVRVGRVESRTLDDGLARIDFVVSADQPVRTDTVSRISYLNLLGQRYLALEAGSTTGKRLAEGSTLGLENTRPALDLTELFNAFKPMFEALDPKDVNLIATEVVQTLQGEGPRLTHLMEQTSQLTAHLADRDEVISRVIDNVTVVMQSTSEHRDELRSVIGGLDSLVGDLADDSGEIESAVVALDRMTASVNGLLDETSGPLTAALERFAVLGETIVANNDLLAKTLDDTPRLLEGFNRALSHGSWLNTYVCTLDLGASAIKSPDLPGLPHSRPCR